MRTLGVDLAARPPGTAACLVEWSAGPTVLLAEPGPVDDGRIEELAGQADKVGMDVPFGWPEAFVEDLTSYHRGGAWKTEYGPELRLRVTDRFVKEETGKTPFSVSADRIATCAMRAARLLSELDPELDRTGSGRFVEVYPAAALRVWDVGRLEIAARVDLETDSPDLHDAAIAALVARAAALGLCHPVPIGQREVVDREGWIALPQPETFEVLFAG